MANAGLLIANLDCESEYARSLRGATAGRLPAPVSRMLPAPGPSCGPTPGPATPCGLPTRSTPVASASPAATPLACSAAT